MACYNLLMDKKSRIMVLVVVILIIVSIFVLYRRSYVNNSFEIINEETEEVLE
jgi:CHASE3 domain sensor protein